MLQVAAGQRDELMLYGDDYPTPDGTCVRDYIHVADLATAHLLALDAIKPGRARGLQPRQRRRLQHQAGHRGGPRGHRPPDPGQAGAPPPGDPAATVAASDKARRELGWRPARPALRDIIADAWSFHQSAW